MKNKLIFFLAVSLILNPIKISAQTSDGGSDKEALDAFEQENTDTSTIFSETLDQYPACLAYAIVGISLYCKPTYYGCDYYVTLRVQHNNPDILTFTNRELKNIPWKEWGSAFGKAYSKYSENIIKRLMPSELKDIEVFAGPYQKKGYGKHQTVELREAEVVGHPVSLISRMFDQGGLQTEKPNPNGGGRDEPATVECDTAGCLEEEEGDLGDSIANQENYENEEYHPANQMELDADEYIANWPGSTALPGSIASFFNIGGFANQIAGDESTVSFVESVGNAVSDYADSQDAQGERLFCPSTITPVVPYYLSGIDGKQWRLGYPITDPHMATTIINPISRDIVGPSKSTSSSLISLKNKEIWGHIYPREGTTNQPDDGRASAVIQVRGLEIANDSDNYGLRIRVEPDESNAGGGGWSVLFPEAEENNTCRGNIANLKHYNNQYYNHVSTNWRRYECDLQTNGVYLGTVPIGPIYITPQIPE